MANKKQINYLNKDFSTFKSDLIEYAKSYFPTVYNDFSQASPGSMFIEMAAYIGDVLSYYLDNQLQETFLQYAKQPNNLYSLAYMLGYRPKITSAAIADLDVFQTVPSKIVGGQYYPDFDFALVIQPGMQVQSNVSSTAYFYVPEKVDFTTSSSYDPTDVSIYSLSSGNPDKYLLKKSAKAISGQLKSQTFSFGNSDRFPRITLNDSNIISIVNVTDSSGNIWYEVPYLAQDYIFNPVQNTSTNYPSLNQFSNQVPYIIDKISVPRRFISRVLSNQSLILEFGSGINSVADSVLIPDPSTVGMGLTNGLTLLNTAFDPTNFVTTQTYGLTPKNTTLTVQYLVGGGASANAQSNQLTVPISFTVTGNNTSQQNSVVTNNPLPAAGGGDGDTVEELRMNSMVQYSSQLRAVTQQDYMSRVLSMHPKFGKISKVYVTKDDSTFTQYSKNSPANRDQSLVSLYILGLDSTGNLAEPSQALSQNVDTYLSEYRMMTDTINIKSAFIINIGCNFDVIIRPNFSGQDVIARCITALQDYFNIDNFQINQPIIISNIYSLLDQVQGVQTTQNVQITNLYGESSGYSKYSYDIPGATINDILYPSLDPSIFEVKYLGKDIQGRVVTF
jgi:hypothetical protein